MHTNSDKLIGWWSLGLMTLFVIAYFPVSWIVSAHNEDAPINAVAGVILLVLILFHIWESVLIGKCGGGRTYLVQCIASTMLTAVFQVLAVVACIFLAISPMAVALILAVPITTILSMIVLVPLLFVSSALCALRCGGLFQQAYKQGYISLPAAVFHMLLQLIPIAGFFSLDRLRTLMKGNGEKRY